MGIDFDPRTSLTLGTYGVMAALGLGLHQHRASKSLGSSVMIAAGIGAAFTIASLAVARFAKAPPTEDKSPG